MVSDVEILKEILSATFSNSTVPDDISKLGIGDLVEWDSLGNFNFLLAIEEKYDLRFDIEQMADIKSVQDVLDYLADNR